MLRVRLRVDSKSHLTSKPVITDGHHSKLVFQVWQTAASEVFVSSALDFGLQPGPAQIILSRPCYMMNTLRVGGPVPRDSESDQIGIMMGFGFSHPGPWPPMCLFEAALKSKFQLSPHSG